MECQNFLPPLLQDRVGPERVSGQRLGQPLRGGGRPGRAGRQLPLPHQAHPPQRAQPHVERALPLRRALGGAVLPALGRGGEQQLADHRAEDAAPEGPQSRSGARWTRSAAASPRVAPSDRACRRPTFRLSTRAAENATRRAHGSVEFVHLQQTSPRKSNRRHVFFVPGEIRPVFFVSR